MNNIIDIEGIESNGNNINECYNGNLDNIPYYECKRCFYKSNKMSNIKNHLNKAKKCERSEKSYEYDEDKLYELSLVKNVYIDNSKKFKCSKCSLTYSTNGNLKRHMEEYCYNVNNINIVNNSNKKNIK